MFKWLNKQGVESDKGFSVQFTGRFTCEYREGDKVLAIEIDDGYEGKDPCILVELDEFSKWGEDKLSARRQEEIIKNFKDALAFQGLSLIVNKK